MCLHPRKLFFLAMVLLLWAWGCSCICRYRHLWRRPSHRAHGRSETLNSHHKGSELFCCESQPENRRGREHEGGVGLPELISSGLKMPQVTAIKGGVTGVKPPAGRLREGVALQPLDRPPAPAVTPRFLGAGFMHICGCFERLQASGSYSHA